MKELKKQAAEINRAHRLARTNAESAIQYAIRCGELLTQEKKRHEHGEWKPWVGKNCEFSYESAKKYMRAYSESQKGNVLPFSTLNEALGYESKNNHLTQGTGENEWYTPSEYVDKVKAVMGEIDLDPASEPNANKIVKAKKIYTAKDSGLEKTWAGRVWLNPPYSRDLMPAFVEKLISEYLAGHVSEAILVSHNNTETNWFQSLALVSTAICFPSTRIKFYRGKDIASPVNGQVFFYLGKNSKRFNYGNCRSIWD